MTDIRFQLIKPRKAPKTKKTTASRTRPVKDNIKLSPTQSKGLDYEKEAIEFLSAQGLQPLTQNLSCKFGELDLVMKDGDTLVIIEVRTRKNNDYGGAIASITPSKQHRIKKTTLYFLPYLQLKYFNNQRPFCRFDAYCIQEIPYSRQWLKNIFN